MIRTRLTQFFDIEHPIMLAPMTPAAGADLFAAVAAAADAFLAVLTNGKVPGDKVGPHIDLLTEFPYLGPPHNG
jgi:NAD(P)H-dependent flavin oxidoreductase YrpB (nitropropane dioxygenase family)